VAEPRVSVLVTAFEHERFIARALDGVLDQRGVSFELLIGDDASTDGTRAVIERYARAHPELIRTLFPERNLGQGGSALFGALLGQARGELVAGLDGDDYWTSPDKLSRQVEHMDANPGCAMCFHEVIRHHEDGSQPDTPLTGTLPASSMGVPELLAGFQIGACATLFRRAAIHPLPDWYFDLPWGDAPLYILAASHGTIDYLPESMGVYRIHSAGMYSGIPRVRVLELQTKYYEHVRVPPEHEPQLQRRLADTWVKLGLEHARLGSRDSARECLARSLQIEPFDPRRLAEPRAERRRLALWLRLKAPAPLRRRVA
jgi:glycosyltransferase involved in cell wall biosynthesis